MAEGARREKRGFYLDSGDKLRRKTRSKKEVENATLPPETQKERADTRTTKAVKASA